VIALCLRFPALDGSTTLVGVVKIGGRVELTSPAEGRSPGANGRSSQADPGVLAADLDSRRPLRWDFAASKENAMDRLTLRLRVRSLITVRDRTGPAGGRPI
jgi:hypothetical protein